tara:strand:- start:39 stop:482 length:444 start_codon:yes stop_codon:yes gene_type:complete
MRTTKTQSALEYLMIIALALGIIVPTTYLLFRYTSESNVQIIDSQISQIGRNIIDTAETVYFSGEDAKIVLELNMPENVDDIYILDSRELVFKMTTEIGESEVVFFSSIPVAEYTDLSEIAGFGLKKLNIESDGSQVLIGKFGDSVS